MTVYLVEFDPDYHEDAQVFATLEQAKIFVHDYYKQVYDGDEDALANFAFEDGYKGKIEVDQFATIRPEQI